MSQKPQVQAYTKYILYMLGVPLAVARPSSDDSGPNTDTDARSQ